MRGELNGDFRCVYCRAYVVADPAFAGVKHRNHCPYCLWSRHMDLCVPGDRLSACKAAMRPLGLTSKLSPKKYNHGPGELMLCHQCTECGRISINRIAADDDPQHLFALLSGEGNFVNRKTGIFIEPMNNFDLIQVLSLNDRELVETRLFGIAG